MAQNNPNRYKWLSKWFVNGAVDGLNNFISASHHIVAQPIGWVQGKSPTQIYNETKELNKELDYLGDQVKYNDADSNSIYGWVWELAGSIAADPMTYVTFGGSAAAKTAGTAWLKAIGKEGIEAAIKNPGFLWKLKGVLSWAWKKLTGLIKNNAGNIWEEVAEAAAGSANKIWPRMKAFLTSRDPELLRKSAEKRNKYWNRSLFDFAEQVWSKVDDFVDANKFKEAPLFNVPKGEKIARSLPGPKVNPIKNASESTWNFTRRKLWDIATDIIDTPSTNTPSTQSRGKDFSKEIKRIYKTQANDQIVANEKMLMQEKANQLQKNRVINDFRKSVKFMANEWKNLNNEGISQGKAKILSDYWNLQKELNNGKQLSTAWRKTSAVYPQKLSKAESENVEGFVRNFWNNWLFDMLDLDNVNPTLLNNIIKKYWNNISLKELQALLKQTKKLPQSF